MDRIDLTDDRHTQMPSSPSLSSHRLRLAVTCFTVAFYANAFLTTFKCMAACKVKMSQDICANLIFNVDILNTER